MPSCRTCERNGKAPSSRRRHTVSSPRRADRNALSPFWHLPGVPVDAFAPLPGAIELALAAVLVLVGLWGYRRRDLTEG